MLSKNLNVVKMALYVNKEVPRYPLMRLWPYGFGK